MTERERLIELIRKFDIMSIPTDGFIEGFADYLIGNGIVVLPKVPQESHAEGCCIGKIGEWQGNPKYINQKQCYNSELDIRPIRYNDGESILTLPVKIGDIVYTNISMENWENWYITQKQKPYQGKVIYIGINGIDNFMNVELEAGKILFFPFSEIGKSVFLTKESALNVLNERGL